MAKEIEEQPTTIKTGIKEYVDNLNKDINIFNFPWKIEEINSININRVWNSVSLLLNGKILV